MFRGGGKRSSAAKLSGSLRGLPLDAAVRRTDLFAALSLATDIALGQPAEFALRSAVLAVRLAAEDGADDRALAAVRDQALLRYIGCNADTFLMAALLGDEYALRRDFARIDNGRPGEVIGVVLRAIRRGHAGSSPAGMLVAIARGLARAPGESAAILSGHCEVARRIAERLDLPPETTAALYHLYERWDGKGMPAGLKGEAVPYPVRVVSLAQDALVLSDAYGPEAACARITERSGGAYDPRLAALVVARLDRLLPGPSPEPGAVEALVAGPPAVLTPGQVDAACLVFADMADVRMPHTLGHSRAVSDLAAAGARRLGLPEADVMRVRRAGLVHDIGELAVPVSLWMRTQPFAQAEREQMQLHPWHSARIVSRAGGALAGVAAVAALHHERLDGSGYLRGARAAELAPAARLLAAAEAYQSAIEPRAFRAALRPEAAAARVNAEIRSGRLCPEAGAAVLEAAGQRPAFRARGPVADLSPREIEVLRRLAAGRTVKELARDLEIAPKTAGNHVQSIYAKLGVTTRGGAVLFAVENGLHRPE